MHSLLKRLLFPVLDLHISNTVTYPYYISFVYGYTAVSTPTSKLFISKVTKHIKQIPLGNYFIST